jgi:neurofibromin 1
MTQVWERLRRTNVLPKLLTKDLSLSVTMASICPSSEVDELAVCLLTVFEQRGLIFELLEALIKQEVEDTGNIDIFPVA